MDSPNIFIQLPQYTFKIKTFFILPTYATTFNKQLIRTSNNPILLGNIYQGLVKFIINKYNEAKYLPLLKYQVCSRSPISRVLYTLKTHLHIHIKFLNTTFPLNNSFVHED